MQSHFVAIKGRLREILLSIFHDDLGWKPASLPEVAETYLTRYIEELEDAFLDSIVECPLKANTLKRESNSKEESDLKEESSSEERTSPEEAFFDRSTEWPSPASSPERESGSERDGGSGTECAPKATKYRY